MNTRKIILLALCAALAIVAILQQALKGGSSVKVLSISESPNKIEISSADKALTLTLDGNDWYTGNFLAETSYINNMVNCLKDVKVLDKVATLKSDDYNSRYDLNDAKAITVKAYNGAALIRTIKVGKASNTASQSYIAVGDGRDVYLVSGNYNAVFNKTADDVKNMMIYNISTAGIVAVDMTVGSEHYKVSKTDKDLNFANTDNENPDAPKSDKKIWELDGDKRELNSDEVNSWVTGLSLCNATKWLNDDDEVPGEKVATCKITNDSGDIVVDLYSKAEVSKDDDGNDKTTNKYYVTCSKTTHKAQIGDGTANKYTKALKDLLK